MGRTLTDPRWKGWKYDYDDKQLRILSYPEQGYEIDIGKLPQPYSFYMKDLFARLLDEHWVTNEIYTGLANACEEAVEPGLRAVALKVQRDYRENG